MYILEKASILFMRNGVRSVTMDDLAKDLSMSKKTFYKYFKNKNELVVKILEIKIEEDKQFCEECIENAENAIDELIQMSKFISMMFHDVPSSVFYDLSKYHPEAWKLLHEHKNNYVRNQISQNIERGKREGLYREKLNKDIISTVYIASMDAVFDGQSFIKTKLNLGDILIEIIRFQIRGMVNHNGLEYLKERIKKEENV